MATERVSSPLFYDSATDGGLSTNLNDYVVDGTNYRVDSRPVAGVQTSTKYIYDFVKNATAPAVKVTAFSDLYYNRIWIIPQRTDFGNMPSDQTINIFVWNAYFTSKNLTAITPVNLDGTELTGAMPPKTFNALEYENYSLKVSLAGSPVFDGYYEWTFTGEAPARTYAKGRRVVVFPFKVNTGGGVKETFKWVTTVTPNYRVKEQRRRLRKNPRRKLEYNHSFFTANERQLFRALLFGWQMRTFAVPIWLDRSKLTAQLNAGATSLSINTQYKDYDNGGLIVFWRSYNDFELCPVTEVDSNSVTFQTLQRTWPVGTQVMPARLATLSPEVTSAMHKRNFETVTLLWQIQNIEVSTNRIANASYDTYKGYPVFAQGNDWGDAIEVTSKIEEQVFDGLIGAYNIMPKTNAPVSTTPYNLLLTNRQKIAEFIGFIHARAGRQNPVWLPSYQDDFTVQALVGSSATTIDVDPTGYSLYYQTHVARRDICIIRPNGQRYYRRITGVAGTSNKDTISIDSPLGFTIAPGDGTRVCFLYLCRLGQDNLELNWLTDDKATSAFTFEDLIFTP